jgi:signal transduction histidine kinase
LPVANQENHAAQQGAQAESKLGGLGLLRSSNELAALDSSLRRLDHGLRGYVARIDELEQARARFFRSVSHELRTPLTALRAGLENLADAVPPPQRPALATLEGELLRLGRLVDELLTPRTDGEAFALTTRAPVDLGVLVQTVAGLLAGRAERAGITLHVEAERVVVQGDSDRLRQALLNLADNALRVTPPGGTVTLAALQRANAVRLAVADSGPGVAPEERERIWERGVRGENSGVAGSAGLGLAIVREIAAAHGGRASLDEAYEPGARFVIELPVEHHA